MASTQREIVGDRWWAKCTLCVEELFVVRYLLFVVLPSYSSILLYKVRVRNVRAA